MCLETVDGASSQKLDQLTDAQLTAVQYQQRAHAVFIRKCPGNRQNGFHGCISISLYGEI